MYERKQQFIGLKKESCFLWGARQTGKSTLLKEQFPDSLYYDLLLSDVFFRLSTRPSILREELLAMKPLKHPVIIDEVQKIPLLLDEVHWLIVNHKIQFILCGSSARKIKRLGANLLGGRALRYELFPLSFAEISDFNLLKSLNNGLLPRHYLADDAKNMLLSYTGDYLKEEIMNEALVRNIPSFNRFLEAAAFSNGQVINFSNISRECGVSVPTVKEYFQILTDTLIANFVPAYTKRNKRRTIHAPKFYFFDIGIVNILLKRSNILFPSEIFGHAFEHFIFQEIVAHSHYSGKKYSVSYWRTSSQFEVDFILGNHEVAVEIKGTKEVQSHHLSGLKAFMEDYPTSKAMIVSMDDRPRLLGKIIVLPWKIFLEKLWGEEII